MLDPAWARDLLVRCRLSKVAFFMKQMNERKPIPRRFMVRQFPEPEYLFPGSFHIALDARNHPRVSGDIE